MTLPVVAHLDQWFGPWAMLESAFRGLEAGIRKVDLHAHVANEKKAMEDDEPAAARPLYVREGNIAIIELNGPMTKYGSSMTGPGTLHTRKAIRKAAVDPDVQGIFLQVHSPGGTVSGTGDLAADVAAIAARMPVLVYGEDLVASAAYWVASQGSTIWASQYAEIGSIGTYAVVEDWSKAYEAEGVKVHVVKAGAFKGVGIPGTEVTDDQLAVLQSEVDAINEFFVGAVAAGRKFDMDKARGMADGRVHLAGAAKQLGLIDEVGTIDAAKQALRNMVAARSGRENQMDPITETGGTSNSNKPVTIVASKAASIAELKAINADPGFVLACVEAGLTPEQAKAMNTTQVAAAEASKKLADENAALKLRVEKLEKCGGAYASDPGDENDAKPTNKADAARFAEWKQNETALRKMGYKSFEEYAEIEAKVDESLRVSRN